MQVKQNVQRTLASDLQKLSVKFRKQQRTYLNKLRQRDEPTRSGGSLAVLDDAPRQATEEEYDAGFSETQVLMPAGSAGTTVHLAMLDATLKLVSNLVSCTLLLLVHVAEPVPAEVSSMGHAAGSQSGWHGGLCRREGQGGSQHPPVHQ